MRKKIFSITLINMLLLTSFASLPITSITIIKKHLESRTPVDCPVFAPQNITMKGDASYKPDKFCHIETWYFEAIFDNILQYGNCYWCFLNRQ
jgi:hypothetical protein